MTDEADATIPQAPSVGRARPGTNADADLGARYDIGPVLGRGGMGEVRLARDARIERDVAVKLMHAGQRDDTTVARFFREARVQGALEHPSVVPVHDLGIDRDGSPYFVMKRLAGTTLHDVFIAGIVDDEDATRSRPDEARTRWPRRQLLARFVDVCLAIEFAHTRGVVHRDVKPANIMLGDFGEAYVLDWGLARIVGERGSFRAVQPLSGDDAGKSVAGELLGTPGYMSPEQVRGEQVDGRTDVFALGCVLFEILVGKPALPRGLTALAVTLSSDSHRPSTRITDPIAPELDDICARATDTDREVRPSARELAEKVQAYLDGDRDLARRRALAEEHARRALTARDLPGDEARSTAMREAGRALALDPGNPTAQLLLGGLLLRRPDQIPAGALVQADAARAEIRQRVLRFAALGYLGMMLIVPIIFAFEVHATWPIVTLIVVSGATALAAHMAARQVVAARTLWFPVLLLLNCGMLALTGVIFGPLFLLPMFLTGSLAAWLIQPLAYSAWFIVGAHALAIVPLLVLELTGILPPSFRIEGNHVVLQPWVLDITPVATVVIYTIAIVTQTASSLNIMLTSQRIQTDAQNQVHAHTWHLSQLLPRSGDARGSNDV